MPQEHEGDLGFAFAWRDLMKRSRNMNECPSLQSSAYNSDMFKIVWWPILAAISYGIVCLLIFILSLSSNW